MGRGVPRDHVVVRLGQVGADQRGPRAHQHLVHPTPVAPTTAAATATTDWRRKRPDHLPHHVVQLAGGEDPRRQARATG